ncbi:hypothetical protein C8R47DRAFT_1227201 [Mycena vitilis]|nr:hypothetical protein C8R47DRAFT_1227201 [Mycena vitilis]
MYSSSARAAVRCRIWNARSEEAAFVSALPPRSPPWAGVKAETGRSVRSLSLGDDVFVAKQPGAIDMGFAGLRSLGEEYGVPAHKRIPVTRTDKATRLTSGNKTHGAIAPYTPFHVQWRNSRIDLFAAEASFPQTSRDRAIRGIGLKNDPFQNGRIENGEEAHHGQIAPKLDHEMAEIARPWHAGVKAGYSTLSRGGEGRQKVYL